MELICPECRGVLSVAGRTATCKTHGGQYELLFDRVTDGMRVTAGSQSVPTDAVCVNHPKVAAAYACPSCNKAVCSICAFEVGGRQYCTDCAVTQANAPAAAIATATAPEVRRSSVPQGMMCAQHADVEAVAQCRVCGRGSCPVCDFELPGGIHVCPGCVETQNDQEISPKRRRRAWISVGLAALTTLFLLFLMTGMMHSIFGVTGDENEVVNTLIGNLILWPAIGGLALGFISFDRRLRNPGVVWTAVIWNCSIVGIFILLMIVGLTMG